MLKWCDANCRSFVISGSIRDSQARLILDTICIVFKCIHASSVKSYNAICKAKAPWPPEGSSSIPLSQTQTPTIKILQNFIFPFAYNACLSDVECSVNFYLIHNWCHSIMLSLLNTRAVGWELFARLGKAEARECFIIDNIDVSKLSRLKGELCQSGGDAECNRDSQWRWTYKWCQFETSWLNVS